MKLQVGFGFTLIIGNIKEKAGRFNVSILVNYSWMNYGKLKPCKIHQVQKY